MKRRVVFLCTGLLILGGSMAAAQAAVIYVDRQATGADNGTSWEDAFRCLQDALDVSFPGDQLWVAQGSYRPNERHGLSDIDPTKTFSLRRGVKIYGGFASGDAWEDRDWRAKETILTGAIANFENNYHVVTAMRVGQASVLDGFTITAGVADGAPPYDCGAGLYVAGASPSVSNCKFAGNVAHQQGGAVFNDTGRPSLVNCIFLDNRAGSGGALATSYGDMTVVNALFYLNGASDMGGAIYSLRSSPTIVNCTVRENTAVNRGGGLYNDAGLPLITNCIFWVNKDGSVPPDSSSQIYDRDSASTVTYSCVQFRWPGEGNIDADPMFYNKDGWLHFGSPCTDAGDSRAVPSGILTDLGGRPRFQDDVDIHDTGIPVGNIPVVDMGAFEFTPWMIRVDATAHGTNDGMSWRNAFTDLQSALDLITNSGRFTEIWVAAGTYVPRSAGLPDPRTATFQLINGLPLYGGFRAGDIWKERNWAANETILSGDLLQNDIPGQEPTLWDNSYHVVTATYVAEATALDGFTVRAGYANGSEPFDLGGTGGGMLIYEADPTIRNCAFRDNVANRGVCEAPKGGGGVCIHGAESSPTFTDCTFSGNYANLHGGGLFCRASASCSLLRCSFENNSAASLSGGGALCLNIASARVENCIFNGNTAPAGGALYLINEGVATLTNCLLTNNTAESYGGGAIRASFYCTLNLVNCTFHQNLAAYGRAVSCDGEASTINVTNGILWDGGSEINTGTSAVLVRYSDVQGASYLASYHDINVDPLFVGRTPFSYKLAAGSPCIDTGDDAASLVSPDLGGQPRVVGCHVDMGAYESRQIGLDCNGNGITDRCDLDSGYSQDVNGNGIPDECDGPILLDAESLKVHDGIERPFGMPGSSSETPVPSAKSVECRARGISEIGLTFDRKAFGDALQRPLEPGDFVLTPPTARVDAVTSDGEYITLSVSNVADNSRLTVAVTTYSDTGAASDHRICWTVLEGDVDGSGTVDATDEALLIRFDGHPISQYPEEFRYDLNLNGRIEGHPDSGPDWLIWRMNNGDSSRRCGELG